MPMRHLRKYLAEHQVRYSTIQHPVAYTAQQIAASAHIPGKMLAKTVIIKVDGILAMVVMPANERLDFEAFREATGCKSLAIANEYEFNREFEDCETGAMPPFGNLFGMDVFVSRHLAEDEDIAFNAGNHHELLQMKFKDYEALVKPKIIDAMH